MKGDKGMAALSEIFQKIRNATCYLLVFEGGQFTGRCGTGFILQAYGEIVTAAHVICPITKGIEEAVQKDIKILAKIPGKPERWYIRSPISGPKILTKGLRDPLVIDVAILNPVDGFAPFEDGLAFDLDLPDWGDEVFMAGYSDEVLFPFRMDELLSPGMDGYFEFQKAMRRGYCVEMGMIMFKRGMVGCVQQGLADVGEQQINTDLIYIDNGMSSGASGGPVFTRNGVVVGVIIERGLVEIPADEEGLATRTASGITRAISTRTLHSLVCQFQKIRRETS